MLRRLAACVTFRSPEQGIQGQQQAGVEIQKALSHLWSPSIIHEISAKR
jgi:hypothetical protein